MPGLRQGAKNISCTWPLLLPYLTQKIYPHFSNATHYAKVAQNVRTQCVLLPRGRHAIVRPDYDAALCETLLKKINLSLHVKNISAALFAVILEPRVSVVVWWCNAFRKEARRARIPHVNKGKFASSKALNLYRARLGPKPICQAPVVCGARRAGHTTLHRARRVKSARGRQTLN